MTMHARILTALALSAALTPQTAISAPDYSKRLQKIDKTVEASLIGKWTNPVDHLVIEIDSVDLESGKISGKVQPTTGPAAADEHELTGWISAAPVKEGFDNVTPITFSTTLYEYGTLPAWAGYLKDSRIVTMHYLVWPNKTYSWDHISAFSETWTKL
jgi:hypothetical protein